MGKSSPPPIDYSAAALAEGEASRDVTEAQTWANRPDQVNPWGRVNWTNTPVWDPTTEQNINRWTQEMYLTPGLQEALDSQIAMQSGRSQIAEGMLGDIANAYQDPINWGQFGGMMQPGGQNRMTLQDLPDLWGQVQWDMPQYSTTGTLRQLDYGNLYDVDDPRFTLERAENATYDRMRSRLDQQFGGEEQALEIKLRNQGLVPGDEGYDAALRNLQNRKTDAYQAAQNEAIMAGGTEAQRMFGMQTGLRDQGARELLDLGQFANQASQQEFGQQMAAGTQGFQDVLNAAKFQNQARQQAYQERMGAYGYNTELAYKEADYYNQLRQAQINELIAQRGYSLNEAMALLQGQQVGMPQFNQFSNAQRADTPQLLAAAQLQGQQNAANASAQNATFDSMMGGLSGLAGIAGMFSDRRLKTHIRRIGQRNGINWYSYRIFGQPQIGVMADEVPWAAITHPSGYLMVDYSKV